MFYGKVNTDLSIDANKEEADEDSATPGFSETDFRNCSSTTSACSISYKEQHTVQMAFLPILSMFATVTALKFIPAKWLKIINVRTE